MPDDVQVMDRISQANSFFVRNVSGLRCSWEISRIGLLSFDIPLADLPAQAVPPERLVRKWVKYVHPTAGPWGGVIQSINVQNGIVSIDAESWGAMLRGVLTRSVTKTDIFGAVAEVINGVSGLTGITFGSFSTTEAGQADNYPVTNPNQEADFYVNGQDIYESFLPEVLDVLYRESGWRASLRGLGWTIDPDTRVMNVDFTIGRNLVQTVTLQDRRDSIDSGWTDDAEDLYNHVTVKAGFNDTRQEPNMVPWCYKYAKNKPRTWNNCTKKGTKQQGFNSIPFQNEGTATFFNTPSINEFGRRELYIEEDRVFGSRNIFEQYASDLATRLSRNEQMVTVEIADEGGLFSQFREGDVVFGILSNNSWQGRMVCRNRAYDSSRGTMTVSGEGERA